MRKKLSQHSVELRMLAVQERQNLVKKYRDKLYLIIYRRKLYIWLAMGYILALREGKTINQKDMRIFVKKCAEEQTGKLFNEALYSQVAKMMDIWLNLFVRSR